MLTPASGNTDLITPAIDGEMFDFSDFSGLAEKIKHFYIEKYQKDYQIPRTHLAEFRKIHDWEGLVKQYDTIINSLI